MEQGFCPVRGKYGDDRIHIRDFFAFHILGGKYTVQIVGA